MPGWLWRPEGIEVKLNIAPHVELTLDHCRELLGVRDLYFTRHGKNQVIINDENADYLGSTLNTLATEKLTGELTYRGPVMLLDRCHVRGAIARWLGVKRSKLNS